MFLNILWLSLLLLHPARAASSNEIFTETLLMRPLRDGKLSTHFEFKTVLKDAVPRSPDTLRMEDEPQHYNVFPLALGQILREYAVTELHLTLNSGRWDYKSWGYPEEASVATGAELWAWMGDGALESVDKRWKGLTNALSGLFCASLGALHDGRTTSPRYAFRPEGDLPEGTSHSLRHAILPSERICTENLTPFLKLLPCKSKSGIASLLNPHRVFDADWHGMGIHVSWSEEEGVVVKLTFGAVLDPVRISRKKRDWSFTSLFGNTIQRSCPVASTARIWVAEEDDAHSLSPSPSFTGRTETGNQAVYDVAHLAEPLDIVMTWPNEDSFQYPLSTAALEPLTNLQIRRFLTGSGQYHGGLSMFLKNSMNATQNVVYLETMPWFIKFYLHTLRTSIDGVDRNDIVQSVSYTLPIDHEIPTLLEVPLMLPPLSTVHITLDLDKSFISYTEHPPDAQRGWDLPGAVIIPITGAASQKPRRMYTHPLLADLATPDFSMPYNVIIMTSTLVALLFGSVFNLLTRKFVWVKIVDQPPKKLDE